MLFRSELIALGQALSHILPTTFTISPFAPKLHTPLAAAPFTDPDTTLHRIRQVQRGLGGRVEVRFDSPKWAWLEYRLSQGGLATVQAVLDAHRDGGGWAAWKAAFARLDQAHPAEVRAALAAAERHALWPVVGAR